MKRKPKLRRVVGAVSKEKRRWFRRLSDLRAVELSPTVFWLAWSEADSEVYSAERLREMRR